MDILRYESWNKSILCLVTFGIITIAVNIALSARTVSALEILTDTYKLPYTIDLVEAKTVIDGLGKALESCEDEYLSYRIKYRIGVIYFKSHMLDASKSRFLCIANDSQSPELIQISSLNMVAQICRLRGENKEALNAFQRLADILQQHLKEKNKSLIDPIFTEVLSSALLSKAEIYELEHNYVASIREYNHLLLISDQNKNIMNKYVPIAKDRISNLHLRQGEYEKYVTSVSGLIKDYPEYLRIPIIRLELLSLKFLKKVSLENELPKDSYVAPVLMINYIKKSGDEASAQSIIDQLNQLSKEYKNTSIGILLQYHYAWLLDTLGEKEKAAEIFSGICSTNIKGTNNNSIDKTITNIVQEYAKIQYAIIAGEKADYKEALRVLDNLRSHPEGSHVSKLGKSVIESVQILRREVPINEKEE